MKLKLVQARKDDQGSENDLRGLGQTTLFNDLTPEPVLTVQGPWQQLSGLARELGIAVHDTVVAQVDGQFHLSCSQPNLNHKEKAVNLFAFALILKSQLHVKSMLWEHKRLHHALAEAINQVPTKIAIPEFKGESVTLDQAAQLHLHQAGFSVQPGENLLTLSDHQVSTHLSEFTSIHEQHSKTHKHHLRIA